MKLAIVMPHHWDCAMGGAEYQAKCLVEALSLDAQTELCFIGRNVPSSNADYAYEIHCVRSRSRWAKYAHCFDASQLRRTLMAFQPDVIYQRVANSYTGIVARTAQDIGAKTVWHISSDMDVSPLTVKKPIRAPLDWMENRLMRIGIREVDAIIAQTRFQDELLNTHYGRSADLVVNNFHPEPQEALDKPSDEIRVVWVSNLKPLKRPDKFAQLAERFKADERFHFTMVGAQQCNDEQFNALMAQVDALPRMTYLGQQTQAQVNSLLASAHVFINTSDYEGFPNTFIQSWLRAVPTLSLNVDLDGLLEREALGACCHDIDNLADTLRELVSDSERLASRGAQARAYALENHSIKNAHKINELFVELSAQ